MAPRKTFFSRLGRPTARWGLWLCLLISGWAHAGEATVAVAANFRPAAQALAQSFEGQAGDSIRLVPGSTGKLFAQIVKGAPFDAFLAADQERPARLEAEGRVVPGSRFTYALGTLVLWSKDPALLNDNPTQALSGPGIRHLAMAHPGLAPYGRAAQQVLARLGLADALAGRIVLGQSVGEAHSMVASGNAEAGFVALSGLMIPGRSPSGSQWRVPQELHDPIRQDAVLLQRGRDNPAAAAFLQFLASPKASEIMQRFGYRPGG